MDIDKLLVRIEKQRTFQSSREDSDESFTSPYIEALDWVTGIVLVLEQAEEREEAKLEHYESDCD